MYICVVVSVFLRLFELCLYCVMLRSGSDTLYQELVNKYAFHGRLDGMEMSSANVRSRWENTGNGINPHSMGGKPRVPLSQSIMSSESI